MSEKIDRVAKALSDLDMAEEPMSHYRTVARAAIEAMREPTEEMKASGITELQDSGRIEGHLSSDVLLVANIFTSMIDAALSDKSK